MLNWLRIFVATMSFIVLSVIITILIPRGVSLKTYLDFKGQIIPILEPKVFSPKNISIIGIIKQYVNSEINFKYIFGLLLIISVGVGGAKSPHPTYYLLILSDRVFTATCTKIL